MHMTTITIISASIFLMAFACSNGNADLSDKTISEIAQMIHDEIGNAEAESAAHCEMIPIGVKPAGGPWGYLVFSSQTSDLEKLEKLVERYNELDAQRNEDDGGFSTADFATEPVLTLQNGSCFGDGLYAWNPGEILSKHAL